MENREGWKGKRRCKKLRQKKKKKKETETEMEEEGNVKNVK